MTTALQEVRAPDALASVARLVRSDRRGIEEFGGFYGRAVERLGPLLGPRRRIWLVLHGGAEVGFVDADLDGDVVGVAWFVHEAHRHRGIGRQAVDLLVTLRPWPDARSYVAAIAPSNTASRRLAATAGFRAAGQVRDGAETWHRAV